MKLVPLGERIVLKPIAVEERTKSGIYIPKSEEKKEGIVVEAGTFPDGGFLPVHKGDHVIYSGYSNEELELEGNKFIIVEFKNILARIEPGGNL